MLVDYLKLLAWWLGRPPAPELPPRLDETLRALLRGRSEKQIARDLGVSPHTAHGYIKELHRRFGVATRSELLIRFLPSQVTSRKSSGPPAIENPV